jgi:hypothetical protein
MMRSPMVTHSRTIFIYTFFHNCRYSYTCSKEEIIQNRSELTEGKDHQSEVATVQTIFSVAFLLGYRKLPLSKEKEIPL